HFPGSPRCYCWDSCENPRSMERQIISNQHIRRWRAFRTNKGVGSIHMSPNDFLTTKPLAKHIFISILVSH
ncbi:hypothetical protein PENTCL1PPCAC_19534, partial [Pristionchus entomophagus]